MSENEQKIAFGESYKMTIYEVNDSKLEFVK